MAEMTVYSSRMTFQQRYVRKKQHFKLEFQQNCILQKKFHLDATFIDKSI